MDTDAHYGNLTDSEYTSFRTICEGEADTRFCTVPSQRTSTSGNKSEPQLAFSLEVFKGFIYILCLFILVTGYLQCSGTSKCSFCRTGRLLWAKYLTNGCSGR